VSRKAGERARFEVDAIDQCGCAARQSDLKKGTLDEFGISAAKKEEDHSQIPTQLFLNGGRKANEANHSK